MCADNGKERPKRNGYILIELTVSFFTMAAWEGGHGEFWDLAQPRNAFASLFCEIILRRHAELLSHRKLDRHLRAHAHFAFDPHDAAVFLCERLNEGESQAAAAFGE